MSEKVKLRQENKYLIDHDQANWLKLRMTPYMIQDPYTDHAGNTPVLSMYYDSPHLQMYDEKNQGVSFRNKLRIRVYDYHFEAGMPAFIEVKQRLNDQVRKIREFIPALPVNYLDPNAWDLKNQTAKNSVGILVNTYNLKPACQIFYQRAAYQGLMNSDLRMTFDSQLISLYPEEVLNRSLMHDQSRHIISDTLCILEIKASTELPSWVFKIISQLNLNRVTIPKYISGVDKLNLHNYSIAK